MNQTKETILRLMHFCDILNKYGKLDRNQIGEMIFKEKRFVKDTGQVINPHDQEKQAKMHNLCQILVAKDFANQIPKKTESGRTAYEYEITEKGKVTVNAYLIYLHLHDSKITSLPQAIIKTRKTKK